MNLKPLTSGFVCGMKIRVCGSVHCLKSVQIRTKKTPYLDTCHAVVKYVILP